MTDPLQRRHRHGLNTLKARVKCRGLGAIDRRTNAARGLIAWRNELLAALGGSEAVTPQRAALVDMAVRTRLYIDHVDSFLMEQPTLILKRKRAILPVLRERQCLVDSLARLLAQIGLERQPKAVPSLAEYIARRESAS